MALCIANSALFSISLLTFSNLAGILVSYICVPILICTYQFGLDYLDFDSASNMFEFDSENEEKDKDDNI